MFASRYCSRHLLLGYCVTDTRSKLVLNSALATVIVISNQLCCLNQVFKRRKRALAVSCLQLNPDTDVLSSVQLLSHLSQPDRLVQRDQETSSIALRHKSRKVQKVQVSNLVRLGRRVRSFKTSEQLYKRSKETRAVSCLQFNPDNTSL